MDEDFISEMMERLGLVEDMDGFDLVRADAGREIPFPIKRPIVCFERETSDKLNYLLGYDEGVFGGEKMAVSVLCDEKYGGAFCEEKAKDVCRALLDLDETKMITSVCVEKCMYDRANFAYKVVMRFSLRELLRLV